MNDLQTSLLLIGGAIIAAMMAYNLYNDRRARRQGSLPNVSEGQDPLLGGQHRLEPTGQFNELVQKAFMEDSAQVSLDNELDTATMEQLFGFVYLSFDQPISTDSIAETLSGLTRIGKRAVLFHVTLAGEEDRGWVPLLHGQSISNLRFSLPLANRKSYLTAIDYSEFLNKVQPLSDQYGSHLEFPDMNELVSRAERLDKLAASLDALFGLHCVLPQTADVHAIETELESNGWFREGRHWSKGRGAEHMASVVIHEAPGKRVLSFNLDLPNCKDPLAALNEIAEFGNVIATRFGGSLMDDAGRGLTASSFMTIRNQMMERASSLHDAGFSPGTLQARLLFA
jgi:hypothetical protein